MISTFFSHVLKPLESDNVLLTPDQVPTRFGISSVLDKDAVEEKIEDTPSIPENN